MPYESGEQQSTQFVLVSLVQVSGWTSDAVDLHVACTQITNNTRTLIRTRTEDKGRRVCVHSTEFLTAGVSATTDHIITNTIKEHVKTARQLSESSSTRDTIHTMACGDKSVYLFTTTTISWHFTLTMEQGMCKCSWETYRKENGQRRTTK